jgi:glycosyltransferase involved in cell wall biosynthesis
MSMASRQKITHVISGLPQGGAEMSLWRLLSRMDRGRFQNEVICLTDSGPMADRIRAVGVPVLALGMRRGRPSVGGMLRLTRALRHSRPDVLQTWLYHADLAGLMAGHAAGVPAVVWNIRCSDMDMTQYSPLSAWTRRACARWSHKATAVVVNSEAGRRYHEGLGYRPKRWVLIPNGVDTSVFRPDGEARSSFRTELGLEEETVLVGLIGRFDPVKNHAGFLHAAATFARTRDDVQFVMAGTNVDWNNPVLSEAVHRPHLAGRVHLLGARTDVPRVTAALDIAVSSSSSEGFSNVLVEAMACGVGCVATDVGDSRRIVGSTGMVVPPKDDAALAAAIEAGIAAGPAARAELGRSARARALGEYDLSIAVGHYEELYGSFRRAETCAA